MSTAPSTSGNCRRWRTRNGFTLIELLVVIAIIAVLIALLLPAVQKVREAASMTYCSNNLKQMGIACHQYHNDLGYFPSGGWGWDYCGYPGLNGAAQPGGWAYPLLPYIEQNAVYEAMTTNPNGSIETPVKTYNCPSRRPAAAYVSGYSYNSANGVITPPSQFRGDYAACIGNNPNQIYQEPSPQATGTNTAAIYSSVIYQQSQTRMTDITRGTTNTYLIGEKFLMPENYYNGADGGDNEGVYAGFDNDNTRRTLITDIPQQDTNQPQVIDPNSTSDAFFGSAHQAGFYMLMSDASVQFINYGVNMTVFSENGNRQ